MYRYINRKSLYRKFKCMVKMKKNFNKTFMLDTVFETKYFFPCLLHGYRSLNK